MKIFNRKTLEKWDCNYSLPTMAQEIHLRVKKGLRNRLIIKVDDVHVCVKKLEYSQFGNVNFMQSNLAFIKIKNVHILSYRFYFYDFILEISNGICLRIYSLKQLIMDNSYYLEQKKLLYSSKISSPLLKLRTLI